MKKINKKGFTLIELLLVIAIIGILAAVLFVSLGSQRDRARETAFKESMRSMVPAATICRDQGNTITTPGTFGTTLVCGAGTPITPLINECDGSGVAETYTVTNGGNDNWNIISTCTTSQADDCLATCHTGGCTFAGAGCN